MAIRTVVKTNTGEEKELYLRLNNIEANNHSAKSTALVRGYISEEAYIDGKHYAHEESIEFTADVSQPLWEQAYLELVKKYPDSLMC